MKQCGRLLATSVAVSGDLIAVGAMGKGNYAGAVYLFSGNAGVHDHRTRRGSAILPWLVRKKTRR